MTEINIYYSRVVHELAREPLKSQQKARAQVYLVQGCSLVNKKLIDIALSFGANLLFPDTNGVTPLEILRAKEKGGVLKDL